MAGHTVSVMWVTEFLTLLILLVAIQVATRQQCGDGQFYRGEHFGCNPCKLCTSSDDIPGCEECYSRHCENGWFFHGKDYGCHPCSVCKTPDDLPGCDECDFSTSEPQTLTASDLKNDEAVISEVDDDVVNKDNRNSGSTSDATSTFTSSHQITKEPIKYVIDTDLKVEVEKIKEMDAVMLFVICALCVLVICGIILVLFVFVLRRSWTPRGSGNNPVDTEARLGASGDVEVGVIRHSAGINGHRPIQDHEKHSSDVPGTPSLMENV
ncbi:uncharacterized protein LOC102806947 [Saccoglossus kowalevskii]